MQTSTARRLCCLPVILALIVPTSAAPSADLETAIPGDTALCLRLDDPGTLARTLRQSSAGEAVKRSPLLQSGFNFLRSSADLFAQYTAAASWAEVTAMMPRQWALLVFAPITANGDAVAKPGTAIIGRYADRDGRFRRLFTERFLPQLDALAGDMEIRRETHAGCAVYHTVKQGERPAYAAAAEEVLILGDRTGVWHVLDHLAGAREGAATKQAVPTGRAPATAALRLSADLRSLQQRATAELPTDSKEAQDRRILGGDAVGMISGWLEPAPKGFAETVLLELDDERPAGLFGIVRSRQPLAFRSAGMLPADMPLHVAFSITSGNDLFGAFRDILDQAQGPQASAQLTQGLDVLRTQLNVDLERDLMPRLGPEVFLAIKPLQIETWAGKRQPGWRDLEIVGGVQVRDPKLVLYILQRIVESAPLAEQGWLLNSESYKGVTVNVATVLHKPGLEIAYGLIDDMLVMARGRPALQRAIDAHVSGHTLLAATAADDLLRSAAVLSVYAAPGPMLSAITPRLQAQADPGARPFLAPFLQTMGMIGDFQLILRPDKAGLRVSSVMPLPLLVPLTAIACADQLTKTPVARRAEMTQKRLKEVAGGIRKYRRQNKILPATLAELQPPFLERLPTDPFAPGALFGYGQAIGGGGFVLTSVGPDGQADVNVEQFSKRTWDGLQRGESPAVVREAKRLIYRYKPKRYADERSDDDEGDIVYVAP